MGCSGEAPSGSCTAQKDEVGHIYPLKALQSDPSLQYRTSASCLLGLGTL